MNAPVFENPHYDSLTSLRQKPSAQQIEQLKRRFADLEHDHQMVLTALSHGELMIADCNAMIYLQHLSAAIQSAGGTE